MPRIYHFGTQDNFKVLVMQRLHRSLEDVFQAQGCRLSTRTVAVIALQLIQRVQMLHEHSFIHRDLKPENFMVGFDGDPNIYLIDYGLAKRWRERKTGQHISFAEGKPLTGTARYASINTHLGMEQSRRDDLESIGYILVYLMKGSLPWQGVAMKGGANKYNLVKNMKI